MILITGKMVPVTWCRSLSHMRLTSSPLQKMNLAQHFLLSTSSSQRLREIVVTEGEKEIVVEGVSVPSPRQGKVVNPPVPGPGCHEKVCHPLCRLPFVNEIKHTDVLILEQFLSSDGTAIDREVTGLCKRQHRRITKLIQMSQKAGLMPKDRDFYWEEKEDPTKPWLKYKSYWDENSIDTQWLEARKRERKSLFTK